jgi:hypothetical protein
MKDSSLLFRLTGFSYWCCHSYTSCENKAISVIKYLPNPDIILWYFSFICFHILPFIQPVTYIHLDKYIFFNIFFEFFVGNYFPMRISFIFLFIYFNISQLQCETPSCKCVLIHFFSLVIQNICLRSNCTTDEACWRDALAYRSSELIEQLFSFSSLSVHVDTYQRHHSSEVRV